MHKETYINVQGGYNVIPTSPKKNLTTVTIAKATLITGTNCRLYSRNIDLKLPSTNTLHKITTANISYELNFDKAGVGSVKDKLSQLPEQIDNRELMNDE